MPASAAVISPPRASRMVVEAVEVSMSMELCSLTSAR
jgi:hypothetical protein